MVCAPTLRCLRERPGVRRKRRGLADVLGDLRQELAEARGDLIRGGLPSGGGCGLVGSLSRIRVAQTGAQIRIGQALLHEGRARLELRGEPVEGLDGAAKVLVVAHEARVLLLRAVDVVENGRRRGLQSLRLVLELELSAPLAPVLEPRLALQVRHVGGLGELPQGPGVRALVVLVHLPEKPELLVRKLAAGRMLAAWASSR